MTLFSLRLIGFNKNKAVVQEMFAEPICNMPFYDGYAQHRNLKRPF